MSTPREKPSTYLVQDRSNQAELQRVYIQDSVLTTCMGGIVPEQNGHFSHVLDVGCGTGNWLIEFAKISPASVQFVGVDASVSYIQYAQQQAEAAHVSDRVTFRVMDALRRLDFPDNSFDLVNQRLGLSWLRTWEWPILIQEYQRVLMYKGTLRVTEGVVSESTSPALHTLSQLTLQALCQSGHIFSADSQGIIGQVSRFFHQYGLSNIQKKQYKLEFHAGTPEGEHFCEDLRLGYRTVLPFLKKWTRIPEQYEELYQQMLLDMQRPDFVVIMDLETTWGIRS